MSTNERQIEAGERGVALQRDCRIAEIRAGLNAAGDPWCIDCGNRIEAKRREAMPSARRCIQCQEIFERRNGV